MPTATEKLKAQRSKTKAAAPTRKPKVVRSGGKEIHVSPRFATKGGGVALKLQCPKCGAWAKLADYYLAGAGSRVFAHKPCESARHKKSAAE